MALEPDLPAKTRKFRDEVREWLDANRPADIPETGRMLRASDLPGWAETMASAGYLCVTWPVEYGGRGLTSLEVAVLNEEFARAGVPRLTRGMGETLVGPAIIAHGTDEQKAYFLPRIIDGTDRYCQGFSEPDAGSDLASLKTRGVVDGDEVVITGQKVWTSWYWEANMCFCLCRTDAEAPKHAGISYVLVPTERADGEPNGITFRPLRQITGDSHFAETFFDEARAPLFNVIGGLNNGWAVSKTTLGNERGGNATTQHVAFAKELERLIEDARSAGKTSDPLVRQQLAWAYTRVEIMRYSGLRLLAGLGRGVDPGPSSINKIFWSEYQRRLGEISIEIFGMKNLLVGEGYRLARWQRLFLGSRGHTIWGGTAEIQRNILAERALGLPRDPVAGDED